MSLITYYEIKRQCRKLKKLVSFLRRDFNSSKCKTWARMTIARIKLLRNKREALLRQMRRDVALLLQSRQDATARIRVEHVIREQNMMAANEILELFCERLVTRLSIIAKQRECPTDLKEGISSLIFAGPRCSDIPELLAIRDIFLSKYGKDFVSAATDLRPDSGVNRLLVEKLSALNPPGELKLKVMKEIAKEYQVEWDTTDTEAELLKPPEKRLDGPRTFVSAGSLPLDAVAAPLQTEAHKPTARLSDGDNETDASYKDVASAAKAAADSAKTAVAAAKAAAQLSQSVNGPNLGQHADTRHAACRRVHSDIMFDDSDSDQETDMEQPTGGMPPTVDSSNSIRPKLPDYDTIAARFEQLKFSKT
ncbi:uncharacterized protein LOC141643272 [Silene latifolia]|uniref:uncharacterized protein LOC141643272 n=1 Tax=Silene latifolia TaxID=37657 RepID=UPI003D77369E